MNEDTLSLPLHRIAHGRAGDKGNRVNVSVIAYRPELFACLVDQVTEERVAALFAHRGSTQVKRYVLPKLGALNFVIDEALDGGVNQALNLDAHGKTLSYLVLGMSVEVPRRLLQNWIP
jgi:hypothetical protein